MNLPNKNGFVSHVIVDILSLCGCRLIMISPGSRSAPLAVAAAHSTTVQNMVAHDERGAAFFASGFCRATGKAAAVISTSGTAVAEYHPAVAECFNSRLPLVILSADRPAELQDVGANQTINQRDLFGSHVLASLTIDALDDDTDPVRLANDITRVFQTALQNPRGPVHLNVRFREPLAPEPEPYPEEEWLHAYMDWRDGFDFEAASSRIQIPNDSSVKETASCIRKATKGLIVCGPLGPSEAVHEVDPLFDRLDWPVMADIGSQFRFGKIHNRVVGCGDLLVDSVAAQIEPDTVVHIGGLPTSAKINEFLASHQGVPFIKIQNHPRTVDPDGLETVRITGDMGDVAAQLLEILDGEKYRSELTAVISRYRDNLQNHLPSLLQSKTLTEAEVYSLIGELLPDRHGLFLSNSLPIRDADRYMLPRDVEVMVGTNRGVSGIDGIIASSCGFALGTGRCTTLVIGDLAFLHDLNSLYLAARSQPPVVIVLLNNNGGGIFSFLPIAEFSDLFEQYFGTPHDLTFEHAAALFGLEYDRPATAKKFRSTYTRALASHKSTLIEVTTQRADNKAFYENVRTRIAEIINAAHQS